MGNSFSSLHERRIADCNLFLVKQISLLKPLTFFAPDVVYMVDKSSTLWYAVRHEVALQYPLNSNFLSSTSTVPPQNSVNVRNKDDIGY
jgi:hypothetical protein